MVFKNINAVIASTFFVLFFLSSEAYSADIEWKLFLKEHKSSGPILTKTVSEGEEFVLSESDYTQKPSESREILNALDGVRILIRQSPVNSIHIVLNVNENTFERVSGNSLFINLSFEGYVDGQRENFVEFPSNSPLVLTIPQSNLDDLLPLCSLSGDDLICVYNLGGGNFSKTGIKTNTTSTGIVVELNRLSQTVGGKGKNLGFPSNVKIDTWNKIKILFR
ncbi:MAG: hypothetical protein HOC71_14520 [Candidatus Latescibacteria bacterium]|mgnify:CR=1 FL=1|jgi:hypothetical protein|nr:hypothetical protein [Candidatus Latescibacterota bacterium]